MKNKIFREVFKFRGFKKSFTYALQGIWYLFFYHRNMRIIFLFGILAIGLGFFLKLKGIELVALSITITFVFIAEMLNTAIELLVDLFTDKYHPLLKVILDISAAVVLIASINAVAVGYVLFARKLFR